MRILKQRKQNRVDRRLALEGVPVVHPGVSLESTEGGTVRVSMTICRGAGFFERMRPLETRKSYDLDEFGTFVIGLFDGRRTVLDVVNAFEKRFRMSRREVELSVVAFVKLLMQRNVISVAMPEPASLGGLRNAAILGLALVIGGLVPGTAAAQSSTAAPLSAPVPVVAVDDAAGTLLAIRAMDGIEAGRLPGSPGNLALEKWVAQQFSKSGFKTGETPFDAPVFEPGMLTLQCGTNGTFTLDVMHPALMRPGNFVKPCFPTRLVYAGKGDIVDLERLRGVDLAGAIAVMDYDCGVNWLDLLRFDVAGLVFVGRKNTSYEQSLQKIYNSEVAVPRFYIDGKAGRRLIALASEQPGVAVEAQSIPSRWTQGTLRNLWTLIPGSDPQLAEQVVVLTASLDANAVVPNRAFGAQRAVNLHILMSLLEDFKARPPLYSVMLVAVNGHTQRYAGERQLAWHLMANESDVEVTRDEITAEMRAARLYHSEYGKLALDPVPETDKTDLHIMMEVLWTLADMQDAESGLNLEKCTQQDVRQAIDTTEKALNEAYHGFFARRGRDPGELAREQQDDMAMLKALRDMPLPAFMEKVARVRSVFDDETLFEKWRGTMDQSTGQRLYVKTPLQDDFRSQVNRTGQDILVLSSPERSPMSEEARAGQLALLKQKRDHLRKVLVLFNKMDLGVGRSRTYYRQIAVDDTQREMLKDAVDQFVEHYGRWQGIHERRLERDAAAGAIRHAIGRGRVALVMALEMDAHGEQAGFLYRSPNAKSGWFNGFSTLCETLVAGLPEALGTNRYVNALTGADGQAQGHYFGLRPGPVAQRMNLVPDSAVWFYHMTRTPAFSLRSAFSEPRKLFGPDDSLAHIDARQVHALQAWTRQFVATLLASPDLASPANLKKVPGSETLWSTLIRTYGLEEFSGKPVPTLPVPGCLATFYQSDRGFIDPSIIDGDVVNAYLAMTDETATLCLYGVGEARKLAPTIYQMDEDFQSVLYTIDKGRVQSSRQASSSLTRTQRATMPMFPCREFVITDTRDPTMVAAQPIMLPQIWPKTAKGQSDPEKYGVHGAGSLSPAAYNRAVGPIGVYLYRRRAEMEQDALMVITSTRRCLLNATDENPKGEGFPEPSAFGMDIVHQASADMAYLNRYRSAGMHGVVNQLLDTFMARGSQLHQEAEEKRSAHDHAGYLRTMYEALGNQVKAYTELQQMNGDMLKAVIVYMALMLPFCFFLQKLLFNFKRLEHELAGFSAMFFATFLLFRFIHPAFRLAMSPEAIFIAFVLGAIGLFTTGVLRSRFNEEMNLLFRGVGGIGEEVGYGTVGTTAMLIGVQNMRRRRVRTGLTMATIVLVVFSMLAFSSVSRTAKPTLIPKGSSAPYTGLFYHWPGGMPMDEASLGVLRQLFADKADIRVRRILQNVDSWRLERADDRGVSLSIKAITGLPINDLVLRDSMAQIEGSPFSSNHAMEIMLTVSAADALHLGPTDVGKARVRFLGREWRLQGLIDDQRYRLARDLNPNFPLIPFTFSVGDKQSDDALDADIPNISENLLNTETLVIMPEGTSAEMGAGPRSVGIVFPDSADEGVLGRELRRVLDVTAAKFYVGSRSPFKLDEDAPVAVKPGVYYVGSSYRTAIGGLAKLLIPLIIAGSIILNTMLGTVYERKSEIAVFNAIGLNPTHIFMFFLAEATVYSFIGAVGGYLIGQILTTLLKAAGLIQSVNINFSSLMVVYAILFTMALVILSTLYPGYVATRTAVPSGKRKWTMPPNDGQTMKVVFPFIYRPNLAYGVMFYIQQFFAPMSDQSMSDMVATLEQVLETKDAEGRAVLSLRYLLALSPYDLGVTQRVTFVTRYDGIVKSFRLHMEVERVTGRDTNWVMINKPFLERMRKYLIRWRNIDPTRQAWFGNNAVAMFSNGAPPATVPEE